MTLNEALVSLRGASGGGYVSIEMIAELGRFEAEPTTHWEAFRGDTKVIYRGDTFRDAVMRAVKDER